MNGRMTHDNWFQFKINQFYFCSTKHNMYAEKDIYFHCVWYGHSWSINSYIVFFFCCCIRWALFIVRFLQNSFIFIEAFLFEFTKMHIYSFFFFEFWIFIKYIDFVSHEWDSSGFHILYSYWIFNTRISTIILMIHERGA